MNLNKRDILYGIFLIVLTVIPLSPASNFNGAIVFLGFTLTSNNLSPNNSSSKLNTNTLSSYLSNKYWLLILCVAVVQIAVGYYTWQLDGSAADLMPSFQTPQLAMGWYLLERPAHLIMLATVCYYFFIKLRFNFNLTHILLLVATVSYSFYFLLEFILQWNFKYSFYQFIYPWGDLKVIFSDYAKSIITTTDVANVPLMKQEDIEESIKEIGIFFINHINAVVIISNLFYSAFLIKLLSRRLNLLGNKKDFQFRYIRFPEKIVIFFLLGWMAFFIPEEWVNEWSLALFQQALLALAAILGCLYFFQGLGVGRYFSIRLLTRIENPIVKIGLFTLLILFVFFQGSLFMGLFLTTTLSIGLLDQWINYRKI